MREFALIQAEFLLRLVVASLCGGLIGYERKNRLKEAGVRTHLIVALGAALIMIVSKYGFTDVTGLSGVGLDPSRVAAQIVSGIGFLGAGMIFVRRLTVNGLTTAAGIWTTAGVGMAVGAKLYVVGIAATALVLLVQTVLRRNFRWLQIPAAEQIDLVFSEETDAITYVQQKFAATGIEILNLKAVRKNSGLLDVNLFVKLPPAYDVSSLMNLFKDNPHVKSIEY